jgi:hypothetical protein
MKELEILQNKETREQMINKVEVLEKVKDLLLLGDSDFATTQQVANYYEVDSDTTNWQYNNNKDEFISDGLKILKGKETKAFLATESISVTNFRGYFVADNQKFNNNHNVLFTKRSILRMGMLLTTSQIAKEVRNRLLDIEYESNNAIQENGETVKQNITNEINTEIKLSMDLGIAIVEGNTEEIIRISTEINKLKNKRISELEKEVKDITTHALDIVESRKVINRLVRTIASKKYSGIKMYSDCWNELWSKTNYQLGINIKARNKKSGESYINTLTDEETFEVEKIVRTWANQIGIDIESNLSLAM